MNLIDDTDVNYNKWGTEETPKKDSDIARKIIIAMMI